MPRSFWIKIEFKQKFFRRLLLSLQRPAGVAVENCAEPWMAEPKRHTDVPQGACFQQRCPPADSTKVEPTESQTK
jgi:hypothetical protein